MPSGRDQPSSGCMPEKKGTGVGERESPFGPHIATAFWEGPFGA